MISVIIPTYNERDNVVPLLEQLESVLDEASIAFEVIVVDDDSPDQTWKVVQEFETDYSLSVIRRMRESGLATAVLRGVDEAKGNIIVVMDGDLQHPPERVPDLVNPIIDEGVDLVIGSRLVSSGRFEDSSILRRSTTGVANLLAKILFKNDLAQIRDVQSGFFAMKRETVEGVPLAPVGYKILLEILVLGDYDEVREIGYAFGGRRYGSSNLDVGTIMRYLYHLLSLSVRKRKIA